MAKVKSAYVCNDCGADFGKWQGQCSACQAWNTLTRVTIGATNVSPSVKSDFRRQGYSGQLSAVRDLSEIDFEAVPRFSSTLKEFDRVLGGGLVPGSAILIGGNPGAG